MAYESTTVPVPKRLIEIIVEVDERLADQEPKGQFV